MNELDFKAIINRIKFLIRKSGKTQIELANYLGKTRQIFQDWKDGGSKPTLIQLYQISKYFGIPLEYVITGEESPIDDATAAFIVSTNGLTEEQKKIIYASIKAQVEMFKTLNEQNKIDK